MAESVEQQYNHFYKQSKRYFKENKYEKCLEALRSAYKIKSSERLQIKINKLEDIVSQSDSFNEVEFKADENKILIENQFYVNKFHYDKLYNYQQEGVLWLFKLFKTRKGGILADDMGLGKTVQVTFFLRELFESDLIKSALIVMPKSLLINWEREFLKWAPDLTVLMYTANEREQNLSKIRRRGGILLTTYGTIMSSWDELNSDCNFKWDVLALDEGHKIKNPSSKTFKTVNAIRANMRLVLTGTAVQNKLKELWALFDFTHQGSLLGSYPTFNIEYERPLTASRNKDATEADKIYGDEIAKSLKNLIKAYFLRRTKEEVMKIDAKGAGNAMPMLKRKNDLIVWIKMTPVQIDFYQKFLQLDDIKILLTMSEKRSPLVELNVLKKICDHPRLLRSEHCAEMGMTFAQSINDVDISMLQEESGKMAFLLRLLKNLASENHKCLVFSQSKVILSIIQRILIHNDIKLLRLDGDILKPSDRQEIVDRFNNDASYKVLLLTSQVGGVGLTLTGADRAIIYDLSWNPSVDSQAVDRVYRIGQLENVVVYRLITCGTVEEKIYRRQIFKDSVNRQTTGVEKTDKNPFRYFTQSELLELFVLDDPSLSNTQLQLEKMHSQYRKSDVKLDKHIEWLNEQPHIFGVSDHDLMFSKEEEEVDVDDKTRGKLVGFRKQAEERLGKEAMTNAADEEGQLRLMMSKMSLHEYKNKNKDKVSLEGAFIPSKLDIKRPLYNMPKIRQRTLSSFLPANKRHLINKDKDDSVVMIDDPNMADKKDVKTNEYDVEQSPHCMQNSVKELEYEENECVKSNNNVNKVDFSKIMWKNSDYEIDQSKNRPNKTEESSIEEVKSETDKNSIDEVEYEINESFESNENVEKGGLNESIKGNETEENVASNKSREDDEENESNQSEENDELDEENTQSEVEFENNDEKSKNKVIGSDEEDQSEKRNSTSVFKHRKYFISDDEEEMFTTDKVGKITIESDNETSIVVENVEFGNEREGSALRNESGDDESESENEILEESF